MAATLDGINPAIKVSSILMITRMTAPPAGREATPEISAIDSIIILIGIFSSMVMIIPKAPATKPTIKVSALNTWEISRLEAPMLRKIPISFVLSSTDM